MQDMNMFVCAKYTKCVVLYLKKNYDWNDIKNTIPLILIKGSPSVESSIPIMIITFETGYQVQSEYPFGYTSLCRFEIQFLARAGRAQWDFRPGTAIWLCQY